MDPALSESVSVFEPVSLAQARDAEAPRTPTPPPPYQPAASASDEFWVLRDKVERIAQGQEELGRRIAAIELELAEVRAKLDTTTAILQVVAGFLAVVLTIGTVASLIGFIRSESRATEAHKFALAGARDADSRAAQAFQLSAAGETAAQSRAAEVHERFLAGSRETLDLVNATLTLAKEASERAAKTIETRARVTIQELDQEAQSLLTSVPTQDDRALVANPATRSNLRALAHKIAGFEANRFILPEDLQPTPVCLFIRGMDCHLNQQFDEAFRYWRFVALSPAASDHLKSLAWYWIGYEQNNLKRFDDAEQSFDNALQHAQRMPGGRKYELQRILLETRFFNKTKYAPEVLIWPLEQLLEAIKRESPSEELEARRVKIVVTLANVIYQSGRDLQDGGKETESLARFERAEQLYREGAPKDKWALFGLAEMLHLSQVPQKKVEAQGIFKRVRAEAIEESVRREEPRTKVLARTTELMCCLRVPEFRTEAPAIRSLVLQELGRVDERLTVYTQLQKRNVTKAEFQEDLELVMRSGSGGDLVELDNVTPSSKNEPAQLP
jgi:tetratricopeptide (TPR) repeat protein